MTEYTITRESAERDLKALRELLSPGLLCVPAADTFQVLRELRDSIEEQVEHDLRHAAERLINMLDSSPETAAFIADRYPGLDHAFDVVRRHLPQTDDGATPPAATGVPADAPSSPSDAYAMGAEVVRDKIRTALRQLASLRLDAITETEKRCYEVAGNLVGDLLGES